VSRNPGPPPGTRLRLAARHAIGGPGATLLERRRGARGPAPDPARAENIAVCHLFGLGDVVLAIPFARALRALAPRARIVWFVRRPVAPFLAHFAVADQIESVGVGTRSLTRAIAGRARRVPASRPDLGLLPFTGLASAALMAALRPRAIAGYLIDMQVRASFDFDRSRLSGVRHPTEMALDSLRTLCALRSEDWGQARLRPPTGAPSLLPAGGGSEWIALNPGVAWAARRWPPGRWIELARVLVERCAVLLVGGANDSEAAARIERAVPRVLNLAGRTEPDSLLATLAACRVLISSDAGPLHLARALGVPSIALFGPVDPALRRHGGARALELTAPESLPCRPCATGEFPPPCPEPDCMAGIGVDDVLQALDSLRARGMLEVSA